MQPRIAPVLEERVVKSLVRRAERHGEARLNLYPHGDCVFTMDSHVSSPRGQVQTLAEWKTQNYKGLS